MLTIWINRYVTMYHKSLRPDHKSLRRGKAVVAKERITRRAFIGEEAEPAPMDPAPAVAQNDAEADAENDTDP